MAKSFSVTLQNGASAIAARVRNTVDLRDAVSEMRLQRPRLILVLIGGADALAAPDIHRLSPFFEGTLAPLVQERRAFLVDGGTDVGVMRLMGQARARSGSDFPLIGVAAAGTVSLSVEETDSQDAAKLEPHHTHFFLVPGNNWGDESLWLSQVAEVLADGAPAVTILVNGGDIAWEDVSVSVRASRPVIVISGSGRVADELTDAIAGRGSEKRALELVSSGLLRVVNLSESSDTLAGVIEEIFPGKEPKWPGGA